MYSRIRSLRKDNNLKQKDLADYLNISNSTYGGYETGYRSVTLEVWCKLADYYNTSVDYLMGITDEMRPHQRKKSK